MRFRAAIIAAASLALIIPAGLAGASQSAAPNGANVIGDGLGAAGDSEVSTRAFKLPPVGQPPFPTPDALPGLPGSLSNEIVDPVARYVPQTSCDPNEKTGITAFKKVALATYPALKDWGSSRNCTDDGISEHLEGRAWDMNADVNNPAQFAQAAQLLTWLTQDDGANARRLGIMYIGYNHRLWASYRMGEGWRKLNNSNPHTDHVHFSFSWAGATKKTSFWTGAAATEDYGPCQVYKGQPAPLRTGKNSSPCTTPKALPAQWAGAKLLWRGSTGDQVKIVQQKLNVNPVSGTYGAATQTAVADYQRGRGLPVTGAVDAQTYFALGLGTASKVSKVKRSLKLGHSGSDVKRLQKKLKVKASGKFNKTTKRAVRKWQKANKYKVTGIATQRMQRALGL